MKIISLGSVEIQSTRKGLFCHWRLTGSRKWQDFPMPVGLVDYLEAENFSNNTIPIVDWLAKKFKIGYQGVKK